MERCTKFCTPSVDRSRSDQSFRRTKAMPEFWPRPAKLKPATVKIDSTASSSSLRK